MFRMISHAFELWHCDWRKGKSYLGVNAMFVSLYLFVISETR